MYLELPERCLISKSNSAIEMHQRAYFDCFGLIDVNHFKLAWSVIILILRHMGDVGQATI